MFMLACAYVCVRSCVCVCVCACVRRWPLRIYTKSLNIIQLEVFLAPYHTNNNVLVSAPTSVGKPNIAMLTVLREQQNNFEGRVI